MKKELAEKIIGSYCEAEAIKYAAKFIPALGDPIIRSEIAKEYKGILIDLLTQLELKKDTINILQRLSNSGTIEV